MSFEFAPEQLQMRKQARRLRAGQFRGADLAGGEMEIRKIVIGEHAPGQPAGDDQGRNFRKVIVAVTYDQLVNLSEKDVPFRYTERDSLLYAVSIGMGRDPLNLDELHYVYEKLPLKVVPTQAVVVTCDYLIWNIGLQVEMFLQGENRLTLYRPLPAQADLLAASRVVEVYDKGAKGCLIEVETEARLADTGEKLFRLGSIIFARGDIGIGGVTRKAPPPHEMPTRAPDIVRRAETRRDQPLLYRLNGDRNLVHIDPAVARAAGFERPIMHGACTYAIACREVLVAVCQYDAALIEEIDVRYTSVVMPGETVETHIWVDGRVVSFRSIALERNVVVIDHGRCLLRETS